MHVARRLEKMTWDVIREGKDVTSPAAMTRRPLDEGNGPGHLPKLKGSLARRGFVRAFFQENERKTGAGKGQNQLLRINNSNIQYERRLRRF
jgi:hypothetical protein